MSLFPTSYLSCHKQGELDLNHLVELSQYNTFTPIIIFYLVYWKLGNQDRYLVMNALTMNFKYSLLNALSPYYRAFCFNYSNRVRLGKKQFQEKSKPYTKKEAICFLSIISYSRLLPLQLQLQLRSRLQLSRYLHQLQSEQTQLPKR